MTKQEILDELARSRAAIVRDTAAVRNEFDVRTKVNQLVAGKPAVFLGGAALLGWILAGPRRKTRTVTKYVAGTDGRVGRRREEKGITLFGILFTLLKILTPLLKPAVSAMAARRVAEMAAKIVAR